MICQNAPSGADAQGGWAPLGIFAAGQYGSVVQTLTRILDQNMELFSTYIFQTWPVQFGHTHLIFQT